MESCNAKFDEITNITSSKDIKTIKGIEAGVVNKSSELVCEERASRASKVYSSNFSPMQKVIEMDKKWTFEKKDFSSMKT